MKYVDSIEYMHTFPYNVYLNPGKPKGQGNIVFLMSNSLDDSIKMIQSGHNCTPYGHFMRYYYYPIRYAGYIGTKRFRLNARDTLKEVATKVRNTSSTMYPNPKIIRSNEKYNTYFDLSKYMELFWSLSKKFSAHKKVESFWELMGPILLDAYGQLKKPLVLINADQHIQGFNQGTLKEKLNNLIYLIYFTIYRRFELVSALDIDWVIYTDHRTLKFNFAKMEEKNARVVFLREFKRLSRAIAEIKPPTDAEMSAANNERLDEIEAEDKKEIQKASGKTGHSKVVKMSKTPAYTPIERDGVKVKQNSLKLQALINLEDVKGKDPSIATRLNDITESRNRIGDGEVDDDIEVTGDDLDDDDEVVTDEDGNTSDAVVDEGDGEELEALEESEDNALMEDIYTTLVKDTSPRSAARTARDRKLSEQQKKIMVKGMTIEDLGKINPKERKIESRDVSKVMNTTNPNMKHPTFANFNKSYIENCMTKDMVGVFDDLKDKSIPMYILSIKVEDTSTAINAQETWEIKLEDENGNRHTVKVDIPKFIDNKFLYLAGNKKCIKNQLFYLPLVKIDSHTVMIVTNYNKMTIQRIDAKTLSGNDVINKLYETDENYQKAFVVGSAKMENDGYLTGIEYDEFAKHYTEFHNNGVDLYFSQKRIDELKKGKSYNESYGSEDGYDDEYNEYLEALNDEYEESATEKDIDEEDNSDAFMIGFGTDRKPIWIDQDTQLVKSGVHKGKTISAIIAESFGEAGEKKFKQKLRSIPKRLMYTNSVTMKKDVPIMILMCIWEGLDMVMKKAKIPFRLSETLDASPSEGYVKCKDAYIIYKDSVPAQMLMNGLKFLKTEEYDVAQFSSSDKSPYLDYVIAKYGNTSIIDKLMNAYEFTITNIDREVLRDMNLPTDIVSLIIYANNLLADTQHLSELDTSNYRIRCAEIIPSILSHEIALAYGKFRKSNGRAKLSIPKDAVIKELLGLKTVEDCSTLNPFLEEEFIHGISTKGYRGVNLDQSYTVPRRSYDKSMVGVIGISSSPDAQVGVNKCLTFEPSINSVRGYIEPKNDKLDELKDVNLFSPAEMLIPLGVTRDDPIRTGHSVKQSRASVPVKGASPVLITNGSDEYCKYSLSSDFVVVADKPGKVVEIDDEAKIMMLEYNDGTHRAVNLGKNIVKNGGGGFELSNVLTTDFKVGQKFKANETIAWHKDWFKKIPDQGVRMCVGAMVKVALYSTYNNYEDASFITERVSHLCETEMVFRINCVLGPNSNIYSMVNIGDHVEVGDPLITFDESFEDEDLNKMFAGLDTGAVDSLMENTKTMKKSDKSGTIEAIKIYSAAETSVLSPSLQKIVKKYYKDIDKRKDILDKYDDNATVDEKGKRTPSKSSIKCGMMLTESSGVTEPNAYGVIRGERVNNGVLIEFYIKHAEPLETGSKTANFSPLKNVVSELVPDELAPYSMFRKDEPVDTTIAPSSILARMVYSVVLTIFGNKVLIELKRSLKDIWMGSGDFATKRKKMCSLIYRVFTALDKSKTNTKTYQAKFEPMSEAQFKSFFKEFFENDMHYLILDIVDYEHSVVYEDIKAAADILGIPLYERVALPHLNNDPKNPIVTQMEVPVGYLHLKRPQQTIMKKNGMSVSSDKRSGITMQVTGADKNGRESDLENCMLVSLGMTHTLKELNGPRADDMVAKDAMNAAIAEKGYVEEADIPNDVTNKTTLNVVNTYLLGMSLHSDLITPGLKLRYQIDDELMGREY